MSLIDTVKCDYPDCAHTCTVGTGHDYDGNLESIRLPKGWEQVSENFDLYLNKHVCPHHTSRKAKAKAKANNG